MLRIKIIRHSERFDYKYPIFWLLYFGHYWADSPLTTYGHTMAYKKGIQIYSKEDEYEPSFIYTSPYTRTMATSTEIKKSFPKSEIIIEPLLSEYQPNIKHCISLYPLGIPTVCNGEKTKFEYPETYSDFRKRVKFIIYKLIEKNNCDFMVITHGEVLNVFIKHLKKSCSLPNIDSVPYLTTLSFLFDKKSNSIISESVIIE